MDLLLEPQLQLTLPTYETLTPDGQDLTSDHALERCAESTIPPAAKTHRLTEALRCLVDLYTAWDEPEAAAKWQTVLDETVAKPNPFEEK